MQKTMMLLCVATMAFASGCGPAGPKIVALELDSSASADGRLTVVRDKPTPATVKGRDSAGALVELDPRLLTCGSSDDSTLEVEQSGTVVNLIGLKDLFDANNGQEPAADLVVAYGEVSARFPADVVLNASGSWKVLVDLQQQTITLMQTGRKVTHLLTNSTGEIKGKALTLTGGTMTIQGSFVSRNEIRGQYLAADGSVGVWQAQR